MYLVLLTALGVGGASVLGSVIGFMFKGVSERFSDAVLSLAAGVMLAAAVIGLILPSLEGGGAWWVSIIGIFAGAVCLTLADKLLPCLRPKGGDADGRASGVLLFVAALAIHNLPEGIAAGVGFGAGDVGGALVIAGSIALQNIPEGMVIVAPMLSAGISARRTFLVALFTGAVEVVGTFIGYFAVRLASAVLPFALGFAGGTMLYVIGDEMIPQAHAQGNGYTASYALLFGFCLMLVLDILIS